MSSVQFSCSVMSDSATLWIAARQASLSITSSWSLLKLMPIESVMPSSHLILCCLLLLLPPIPPSIRVFSNKSTVHMKWPKYWNFSFSISPSNEHPGLISFRMDWMDLLAVQGILKSLLQHHSSKASIFRHSAFFTVQLSHPYMTMGKTIALTVRVLGTSLEAHWLGFGAFTSRAQVQSLIRELRFPKPPWYRTNTKPNQWGSLRQGCSLSKLLFNTVLEIVATAIRQGKKNKSTQILLYIENSEDATEKLLKLHH